MYNKSLYGLLLVRIKLLVRKKAVLSISLANEVCIDICAENNFIWVRIYYALYMNEWIT